MFAARNVARLSRGVVYFRLHQNRRELSGYCSAAPSPTPFTDDHECSSTSNTKERNASEPARAAARAEEQASEKA